MTRPRTIRSILAAVDLAEINAPVLRRCSAQLVVDPYLLVTMCLPVTRSRVKK